MILDPVHSLLCKRTCIPQCISRGEKSKAGCHVFHLKLSHLATDSFQSTLFRESHILSFGFRSNTVNKPVEREEGPTVQTGYIICPHVLNQDRVRLILRS